MKTLFSKYQLRRKSDQYLQSGALLKIIDADKNWGVSDICPWPHLGDLNLEQQISKKGPLYRRAEVLAHIDLQARKSRQKLIDETVVENNFLVTDLNKNSFEKGTLKIKADSQFELLLNFLNDHQAPKMRIDFNCRLNSQQFSELIPQLPKNIEYIEDPTLWNYQNWKIWNQRVPLAVDFADVPPFDYLDAWSHLIIKPSRQDADFLIKMCQQHKKNFTLTSAMDHPVGVAHGLRYAQKHAQNLSGFSTLDLYEENEFNAYFICDKNKLSFKKNNDFGIGMTAALEQLKWMPV